jgi:hypothetical protein
MATLLDLTRGAALSLHRLDSGLEGGAQEFRCILCSPKFKVWIEQELPALESALGLELSPIEQLFGLAQIFCSDEPLTFGDHSSRFIREDKEFGN